MPHLLFSLAILLILSAHAQAAPLILRLTLHDTVQPISAGYLQRGLDTAAARHASLVLLSLDTPGGLLDSTRDMVAAIEKSPVPVCIFVSPDGARAGSAGFFLLEAADVAAMAPSTNAGASHPIVEGKTLDPILKQKIENDAAAFLRSYVVLRKRNVAAAEDAVRNSKSYSAQEALQLRLIDLIEPGDASLIAALDGHTITRFDGASVTLNLRSAQVEDLRPSTRERLLAALTDPNLAVLLVTLGGLLLYLEFNVPGTIVPGALGTLLLLLGLFGLNTLPIHHASLFLIAAAFVLILLEVKVASHGVLAFSGTVALVFGLATLTDGPIDAMRVHLGTALGAGIGFAAVSFTLAWIALRARRNKSLLGPQAMLGQLAIVMTPLAPTGQVEVRGEIWQARLLDPVETLAPGSAALVRALDGLTLIVEPA
jgi:membrane-bound serine protease (ClpP class)